MCLDVNVLPTLIQDKLINQILYTTHINHPYLMCNRAVIITILTLLTRKIRKYTERKPNTHYITTVRNEAFHICIKQLACRDFSIKDYLLPQCFVTEKKNGDLIEIGCFALHRDLSIKLEIINLFADIISFLEKQCLESVEQSNNEINRHEKKKIFSFSSVSVKCS